MECNATLLSHPVIDLLQVNHNPNLNIYHANPSFLSLFSFRPLAASHHSLYLYLVQSNRCGSQL